MSRFLRIDFKTWTMWAVCYSLVLSMFGLTWTVQLLLTMGSSPRKRIFYEWVIISNLKDGATPLAIWIHFGFQVVWFLAAILLMYGNAVQKCIPLRIWVTATSGLTIFSILNAIHFIVQITNLSESKSNSKSPKNYYGYLTLLILTSGAFVMWIINVFFIVIVLKRDKEMKSPTKLNDMLQLSDIQYTKMKTQKPKFSFGNRIRTNDSRFDEDSDFSNEITFAADTDDKNIDL